MAKLKRLKIEKFRNVVPGTELVFNDGYNVLLGQNGTGKTTLLKLIEKVLSSDFSGLEGEAFGLEYEIETYHGRLIATVRNEPEGHIVRRMISPRVVAADKPAVAWSYDVTILPHDGGEQSKYTVRSNPSGAQFADFMSGEAKSASVVGPFEPYFWFDALLSARYFGTAERGALLSYAEQVYRFDEALGGFERMIGQVPAGGKGTSIEIAIDMDGSLMWYVPSYVPLELGSLLYAEKALGAEQIVFAHAGMSFLARAVGLFGFEKSDLALSLQARERESDAIRIHYGKFALTFTLDDGSIITHDALSYGQKRLLSFLYHLALNDDVIIADELVNGLHYDWIEACIEEIGNRQAFLTSQNPILLDFLPFESAEQVRRSFLLCRRERREGGSVMVWQNLDQETAEDFFRTYTTRALQVSEILRTKGLW
jgi:energy-coupling factor transporter ATP-binding protein EcfA2